MTTSPKFGFTLMVDNLLTPEVVVNEMGIGHDCLIAATVKDYTPTPPGTPADGDCYLVGATATGAWAGHDQSFAFYSSGWVFVTCPQYYVTYNVTDGYFYQKGASAWSRLTITDHLSGYIGGSLANQDYTIAINLPFAGTITETNTKCESGTATATFKVNTTALGGTVNSVSSTLDTQAHASSNTFSAGDTLVVTISANSSCVGFTYSVKLTRPL